MSTSIEERRKDQEQINAIILSLQTVPVDIKDIRERLARLEEQRLGQQKDLDDHEKVLRGNGSPGLIKDVDRLNGRMRMLFGILGGIVALSQIVAGILFTEGMTRLRELAAKLATVRP